MQPLLIPDRAQPGKIEVIQGIGSEADLKDFLGRLERHEIVPFEPRSFLTGHATSVLRRSNGGIIVHHKPNLIVSAGRDLIADALCKSSGRPAVAGYIAIGTGSTAAASGQTTLSAEAARGAATYSHSAGTATFTLATTFAAGTGTGSIQEAGSFNASSSGSMLNRVTFSVITKGSSDSLTQTFTFTMS